MPGAAVLRVPILYGEVERVDESAVTVLWDRVQEGADSCTIDHCQQRFPTYCNDVARVCRLMAERRLQVSRLETPEAGEALSQVPALLNPLLHRNEFIN